MCNLHPISKLEVFPSIRSVKNASAPNPEEKRRGTADLARDDAWRTGGRRAEDAGSNPASHPPEQLATLFIEAFAYCAKYHRDEVAAVEMRTFTDQTAWSFYVQYVYVVLNSGMKNTIAEKIFLRFMERFDLSKIDAALEVIGHPGKRKAIATATAFENYRQWFRELQVSNDKLASLDSLPFIGKITKYHLARNLGLDYAKPDRHLVRLAVRNGYLHSALSGWGTGVFARGRPKVTISDVENAVQRMCEELAAEFGLRVGTVDVILWRFLAMKPNSKLQGEIQA